MAYIKYEWKNGVGNNTPVSKDNLNHTETQYDEAVAYVDDKLDDVSQTDQTGSRAIDATIYQNTSGKTRFVTIVVNVTAPATNSTSSVTVHSDAGATPSVLVGRCSNSLPGAATANVNVGSMTFIVPNGNYYKATADVSNSGTAILTAWIEWDLF